ncbi:RnfABCDGE type electron transport complex subunit D [Sporolactobacillus sp. CQH2019]|uniref:RnfABCDGE type electron transport complex subunit D n=1 Tax=Sporolactobacillus sp. CQH2019 TaxID=3023512 RepID=UPI0023678F5B|nr:RnfABCDGE type electron transport complex subunit D [Sporolactobacillus sp. CQH2019]MDD9148595.1 RnfABCDGE type electron transport complex subunit D [Sporolactobacillus sp. CQH2019]
MERIETDMQRGLRKVRDSRMERMHPVKSKKRAGFSFKKFIKSPKGIVFSILTILSLIGLDYPNSSGGIRNIILAVVTGLFMDYVVAYLMERPVRFSDGALVTGLIIGGILSPATSWYLVMLTTVVALGFKHIFKDKRKPIFNPAAIGLLFSATVFAAGDSWWSGLSMLSPWTTVLLIVAGFIIADRINKFPLVFSFLAVYILFFLVLGILGVTGAGDALRMPYINSALFLAFFMLTDPPTSPAKYSEQVFFGFLAAVVSGAAFLYLSKLSYLLVGLLTANAWKALQARRRQNRPVRRGRINVN